MDAFSIVKFVLEASEEDELHSIKYLLRNAVFFHEEARWTALNPTYNEKLPPREGANMGNGE